MLALAHACNAGHAGLGQLANLSPDMAAAVQAAASVTDTMALPFKADSTMGTAPPGSVRLPGPGLCVCDACC